ncbi:MAG: ABC transporter permease subunit [Pseudomonadota bacterium]
MTWTLARMEFTRLMRTPLAWVILAFGLFLLSWRLLEALEAFTGLTIGPATPGLTSYLSLQLYGFAAVLILFITPLLTMRQFSEAFRSGSYCLLSSAPLSLLQILSGKYLGVLAFQMLLILMPLALSLSMMPGTALDFGLLAATTLGLALLSACFAAIGIYFSTLSETPGLAAAGSYGTLLLLTLLGQDSLRNLGGLLHGLAWPAHYLNLQLGLVRSIDLIYFLLLSLFFLGLALYQLDRRRNA